MKRKNKKLKVSVSLPRMSFDPVGYYVEDLEKAVKFFLTELGVSTRLQNTLNIKVHVRKTVLKKDALGSCSVLNNGSQATKDYRILLTDDAPHFSQLQTLAHECVHVEQQVRGRLQRRVWSSDGQTHVRWDGKELGVWLQDVSYADAPWEIEARAKEEKLTRAFYTFKQKDRKCL